MPPRPNDVATALRSKHHHINQNNIVSHPQSNDNYQYKLEIVWSNVIIYVILHATAIVGVCNVILGRTKWQTCLFGVVYQLFASNGITAGAHRLWTHRTYKANLPLRIFLMLCQSAASQNNIYVWSRDHRVHHKFTDTDADPHNSKRGFFFCHAGWLLCKKHRDVMEKGKTIDMTDILADPVVQFQMKYYYPLILMTTFILPTWIPCYFWAESLKISFIWSVTRYILSVNGTWCINSVTHMYGTKPYDKNSSSVQNLTLGILALGEGWHNYHHTFPWDFKANEFGNNIFTNFSGVFISFMAKIGWATELKTTPNDVIRKRVLRTGDGSWSQIKTLNREELISGLPENYSNTLWGWGDNDMEQDEIEMIKKCSYNI